MTDEFRASHRDPRNGQVFHGDPETLGGNPVFVGTRVPVRSLIEDLEGRYTLDEYLDSFPTVCGGSGRFGGRDR